MSEPCTPTCCLGWSRTLPASAPTLSCSSPQPPWMLRSSASTLTLRPSSGKSSEYFDVVSIFRHVQGRWGRSCLHAWVYVHCLPLWSSFCGLVPSSGHWCEVKPAECMVGPIGCCWQGGGTGHGVVLWNFDDAASSVRLFTFQAKPHSCLVNRCPSHAPLDW